jgi:EpsI family protein
MTLSWKNTIAAAGLMLLTAALLGFAQQSRDVPPLRSFTEFPRQIGDWQGRVGMFDPEVYSVLGVDDSFLADYHNGNGDMINLYIGYYQSQKEGDLIHSPKNCMPGAGWGVARVDHELIPTANGDVRVIKLLLEKGKEKQLVLYWFHSRGRIISSEYWQKIYLVMDSMTRRRTDGSFVRLITPIQDGNTLQAADTLKHFAAELLPILEDYIPA